MVIPPKRESEFVNWLQNINARVKADPPAVGVPLEIATDLDASVLAYVAKYNTAITPETRTRISIEEKNEAKAVALKKVRHVMGIVQAMPTVTDAQRLELGLNIRSTSHTPVPPPTESPVFEVVSIKQRRVTIRIKGSGPKGARPEGVIGTTVFTHAGAQPPADVTQWQYSTMTGRAELTLSFESAAEADTVWLTGFFFSSRKESGPATPPIEINLPAAKVVPSDASLKIAA